MNKILVADDSRLVTSLVKNIFEQEKEQYSIISAQDGKEAIDKILSELPDIVLMDWQMPVMNGLEALCELRKNDNTKDIPVIMLTASDNISIAFEKGATDYIPKPFDKTELISRVKSALAIVNSAKEIKRKNVEIEIQREKLKIQKEILVKQKKELNENIELASNIQKESFANEKELQVYFNDLFVLSLPKNEISNNFIWIRKSNNTIFLAVAYCNKLGVASMLINSFCKNKLDDIIFNTSYSTTLQPANILSIIYSKIDETLSFIETSENLINLTICALNIQEKTIQYSGVNVPLYVIKNNKIIELKTDQYVPGNNTKKTNFTNHKVHLVQNDVLYILNDGFNEHYLSSEGSNYLSEEISKMLLKICRKEMSQQKQFLFKTFSEWKSDLKQVEDILVVGLKV
jgi:CheY-like chemotaxis protein/serine phosphatase RsbU (regulator of sigma subunit)